MSLNEMLTSKVEFCKKLKKLGLNYNSSKGGVVKASASEAVDLGLIPIRVKLMTLKLVLTTSLLDAQH